MRSGVHNRWPTCESGPPKRRIAPRPSDAARGQSPFWPHDVSRLPMQFHARQRPGPDWRPCNLGRRRRLACSGRLASCTALDKSATCARSCSLAGVTFNANKCPDRVHCGMINQIINPGRNEQILREKQGHRNGTLLFSVVFHRGHHN